jgi:hypothetical protein
MAPLSRFLLALLSALLLRAGSCLEFTPGSSCARFCLNDARQSGFDPAVSFTNTTEIVCRDPEFSTADTGLKFRNCVECLEKSAKVNETESDLHWYLYNLRYAISTCLFAVPGEPAEDFANLNSPCVTEYACDAIKAPLTADKLSADSDTFGYCSASGGLFNNQNIKSCTSCLQVSGDQAYLSNFVTALEAGCQQTPDPGTLIGLSGTVFAKKAVDIAAPAEDIRSKPKGAGATTLTTGAIVGIAVGAGLLLLGGVVLFIIYWRRQKKFDKEDEMSAYRSHGASPDPFLPPAAKMSASLRSYSGQGSYKDMGGGAQPMSTGEYYDKMEEEIRAGRLQYNYDPRAHSRGPNSALPAHQAYIPQAMFHGHSNPAPPAAYSQGAGAGASYAMGSIQPPAPVAQPDHARYAVSSAVPLPPPPPPTRPKVPSLVLPAVSKLRMPKKYSPPMVVEHNDEAYATEKPRQQQQQQHQLHISQPVVPATARFQDAPLAGGVVYAKDARVVEQTLQVHSYNEAPMKSGRSLLYG